jgi:hypothetical protein
MTLSRDELAEEREAAGAEATRLREQERQIADGSALRECEE